MRNRTTFNVADLLWKVNFFLKNSKPEQVAERLANANLLSSILHDTGNYKGFGYLEQTVVDNFAFSTDVNHSTTRISLGDESRMVYYVSNKLKPDYDAAEKRHQEMFH